MTMYCRQCGAQIDERAVFCARCGCATKEIDQNTSDKSGLVALILAAFMGGLGIHSFYVGKTAIGIAQILTLGGLGIWALVDIIRIAVGSYTDSEGKIVKI